MPKETDPKYFIHPLESFYNGICPTCDSNLYNVFPIEPVFATKDACSYIPMPKSSLSNWLYLHDDLMSKPNLYRRDLNRRMHRYLRASDLKIIRDYVFSYRGDDKKYYRIFDHYVNNLESPADGSAEDADVEST